MAKKQGPATPSVAPPEKKQEKQFVPGRTGVKDTANRIKTILNNMMLRSQRNQFAGILLHGDPGVGKTSTMNFISRLLGIDMVIIETPHIVEEHIVNIPFIVFNSSSNTQKLENTKGEMNADYTIKLADSHLFSSLQAARKLPDEEYIKRIYASSGDVVAVFEHFGGSRERVAPIFAKIRSNYRVILFLDEYFRQTSTRIRNMLRSILNARLGGHDLPKDAYVIYATNLHDTAGALEDIPSNAQFDTVEMASPNKEEWFSWLYYKFEHDQHVKLNPALINKFYNILEEEDLSHNDMDNEVRTSPRRWEQLLLYINQALPVKDYKAAQNLMSNVKVNFSNYLTGTRSSLARKVTEAVAELIQQTSGVNISATAENPVHDWRDTLEDQIKAKMALGEHRKYIPVVSGPPGIGKTAQAGDLARDLGLQLIDIDVSEIFAEDAVGMPIPKTHESGNIETKFSAPALLQRILNKCKERDAAYKKHLEEDDPATAKQKFKEYQDSRWKYLIFFDEFNRTNVKTINALRRVVLEKSFGHGLELPKESIVVAAINPQDIGAEKLTHHMQDVVDVIDAHSSWDHVKSYMKKEKVAGAEDRTHDLFLEILEKFVDKFKTVDKSIPQEQRPFFLEMGSQVYISPREYTQLFLNGVQTLSSEIEALAHVDLGELTPEQLQAKEEEIREAIYQSIKMTIVFPMIKSAGAESPEFLHDLHNWVMNSPDIDIGEGIFYKKTATAQMSLDDIIGHYLEGEGKVSADLNSQFVNFIHNVDMHRLYNEFVSVVEKRIGDEKSLNKYLFDEKYPLMVLTPDEKDMKPDPKVKVSLVEGFMHEMVNAMKINEMEKGMIVAVWDGITEALMDYIKNNRDKLGEDLYKKAENSLSDMLIRLPNFV